MERGYKRGKWIISLLLITTFVPIILIMWIYLSSVLTYGTTLSSTIILLLLGLVSFLHLFDKRPSMHMDLYIHCKLHEKESKRPSKTLFILFLTFSIVVPNLCLIGLINRQTPILIMTLIIVIAMIFVRLKKIPNYLFLMTILVNVQICIISVLGSFVSPIGYDTWRDVIWADLLQIQNSVYQHIAYPAPLVPILYSILSETTGTLTNISPIVFGLTFFNITVILIYNIARILANSDNSRITSLLLSTINPVISFMSVWFVPQAYSGIFVVALMYLLVRQLNGSASGMAGRNLLLALIISCALVLGHVLNALLIILFILVLMSLNSNRSSNERRDIIYSYLKTWVLLLLIITFSYISLTSILNFIVMGAKGIPNTLTNVLLGIRHEENIVVGDADPLATILIYGPLIVCLSLSHVAWIEEEDVSWIRKFTDAGYPLAILSMTVGTLLSTFSPYNYPPRYFILFPTILLILISIRGVDKLCLKHGSAGMVMFNLLICLILCSVIVGGVHVESESLINAKTIFTISAPLKYSESMAIDGLLLTLEGQHVLCTDTRASYWSSWRLVLKGYIKMVEQQTHPASILLQGHTIDLKIIQLGSFGTKVKAQSESELLIAFKGGETRLKGLYIHRRGIGGLNAMDNLREEELVEILNKWHQKIFDGPIEAFVIS